MIKKLASCIGEYKKAAIIAPLAIIGEVVFEVLIPLVMARIVDVGITNGDLNAILIYGAIMLLMAGCALLCGVVSARFGAVASVGFAKNLRRRLFNKVQDFSFKNVDKFSTASLVTRLTTDVNYTQNAFMMVIRVAVRAPLMFLMALIIVIEMNYKLSLVFIAVIPLMAVVVVIMAKIVFPLFEAMFKKFDRMNMRVQENLTAIRVVKAFVREDHETEEFRKASESVQNAQKKAEKIMVFVMPMAQLAMYATLLAVMLWGGSMIVDGELLTGDLMSFITYVGQILMALMMVAMILITLIMSRASVERICEVLDEEIDITDSEADKELTVNSGDISFENVSFGYSDNEEKYIFKNLSLDIKSGETVGIIGGTGSAKTSLVQLILRLYDVQKGEVKVGGHNVKNYTLKKLRDSAAIVLQKNTLFSGTIKENLLWGDESATDEQIVNAASIACADDFVKSFPDGYETFLGQGGVNVSGGQKQRLCIARALLKKPKIMILDDSTSAVDTATDSKIRDALKNQLAGTTVIIIAQRLTSVMDADKIIIMNNGYIEAIGKHDDLLRDNDIYRDIYNSQQKGVIENV